MFSITDFLRSTSHPQTMTAPTAQTGSTHPRMRPKAGPEMSMALKIAVEMTVRTAPPSATRM